MATLTLVSCSRPSNFYLQTATVCCCKVDLTYRCVWESLVVSLLFRAEGLTHVSLLLFCLSLLQPSVLAPGCSMPLCMCLWLPSVKWGYGGHTGKRLVSFRESLVAFELIGVVVMRQLF